MQERVLNSFRNKLKKRFQRFQTANVNNFIFTLRNFWIFFDSHPIYVGIIDSLLPLYPDLQEEAESIFNGAEITGNSEEEAAALGYYVLRKLAEEGRENDIYLITQVYSQISSSKQVAGVIQDIFLDPFYEYVDEHIENESLTLSFLLRYKQRSEWFYRDFLLSLTEQETRKAEKALALNFYAYLHDQGLNFTIEPSSLSGEIDIISAQGTDDPLLADIKIFDGVSRDKFYIRKAFNQIYSYTQQYNEPFGYLVIFKITDRDLCFSLRRQSSKIPMVMYNHKTIFLITIDICSYPKPVSQRNPVKAIIVTEEDLITAQNEDT